MILDVNLYKIIESLKSLLRRKKYHKQASNNFLKLIHLGFLNSLHQKINSKIIKFTLIYKIMFKHGAISEKKMNI